MDKRPKADGKTLKRIIKYITKNYKKQFIFVIICIILSSIAGVAGSLFLKTLIDDYITPLLLEANPVFTGLLKAIFIMIGIYLIGIISTWTYNVITVRISQGVLKNIRDEMFSKMQKLPIKYFDAHTHGDIMSHYTNDTDTLMQMISQSIPQLIASGTTVIAVFCSMISISIALTAVVIMFVFLMLFFIKTVAGKSSKYFVAQQQSIGKVNGYIEEHINGQKVVKIFCHEEESKIEFDKLNEELCTNATNANKYANILMPIMGNLGYMQYVVVAIVRRNFSNKWSKWAYSRSNCIIYATY